jgi:tRNA-splicing ligase RtcB
MRVPGLILSDDCLMADIRRTAAVRAARGRDIGEELRACGVSAQATGRHALEEEMPEAYKDVQDVVGVVEGFGISKKVARLRPIGVVKG